MAGKLPNRPSCEKHPCMLLGSDGSCLMCEGEKLAEKDLERARKRAMRAGFKGRRRRRDPADDLPSIEDGDEALDSML